MPPQFDSAHPHRLLIISTAGIIGHRKHARNVLYTTGVEHDLRSNRMGPVVKRARIEPCRPPPIVCPLQVIGGIELGFDK